MVRLHDRDSNGTISLDEFRSLHLQLTDIKARFAAAAAGGDSLSYDQLQKVVEQQGGALLGCPLTEGGQHPVAAQLRAVVRCIRRLYRLRRCHLLALAFLPV